MGDGRYSLPCSTQSNFKERFYLRTALSDPLFFHVKSQGCISFPLGMIVHIKCKLYLKLPCIHTDLGILLFSKV